MDDDTFQQFIVYDEGESDEHSNDKYIRKQPKITDDQLGKLIAAMNGETFTVSKHFPIDH